MAGDEGDGHLNEGYSSLIGERAQGEALRSAFDRERANTSLDLTGPEMTGVLILSPTGRVAMVTPAALTWMEQLQATEPVFPDAGSPAAYSPGPNSHGPSLDRGSGDQRRRRAGSHVGTTTRLLPAGGAGDFSADEGRAAGM